jgi:hypothetical protein
MGRDGILFGFIPSANLASGNLYRHFLILKKLRAGGSREYRHSRLEKMDGKSGNYK